MKGLLLKDLYMIRKYYKAYFVIAVAFIVISVVSEENSFFVFYPFLLFGMIPVNLLGYDEGCHWTQYSGALPYTRAQIVSAKYCLGLGGLIVIFAASGIAQVVRAQIGGAYPFKDYIALALTVLTVSTVTASVSLPFIFKLGFEKGRIAFFVMIGVACAGVIAAINSAMADLLMGTKLHGILPFLALIGIALYALSWYLSIVFFEKRELS